MRFTFAAFVPDIGWCDFGKGKDSVGIEGLRP